MRASRWLLAATLLTAVSMAYSQPPDKVRWDFNDPAEVLGASNFATSEVKDGLFTGKTNWDPFLSLSVPNDGLDATRYTFLTIRIFSSAPGDVLDIYYSAPNGDASIGGSFPVAQGWAIYTVDLNKVGWRKTESSTPEAAVWGGREKKVNGLRLDPGNEADREIKLDWAELTGAQGKEHRADRELSATGKAALDALSWTFKTDDDFLGWTADSFEKIEVRGGALRGVTRKISFLNSPLLSLETDQHPTLVFTAKTSVGGNGSLYFKHVGEVLADDRTVGFELNGDGAVHTYQVDLSAHPNWKGIINQVRFDLLYVADTRFEITSLQFPAK